MGLTENHFRFGLGLRPKHYSAVLEGHTSASWFEVISENFMGDGVLGNGGSPSFILEQVRKKYPIALHGVSLSLGSYDPLRKDYLHQLKALIERVDPFLVSDHLCWNGVHGKTVHDLMPLPYTEAVLSHLVSRIQYVQDFLQRPILIENVSSYLTFSISEMTEWEFFAQCAKRSGCFLLLDVNNVFVSSQNHGFDPRKYIDALPSEKIKQIHLAGHSTIKEDSKSTFRIDTHDAPVCPETWKLFGYTIQKHGLPHIMVERDGNIPSLKTLEKELSKAETIALNALQSRLPSPSLEVSYA